MSSITESRELRTHRVASAVPLNRVRRSVEGGGMASATAAMDGVTAAVATTVNAQTKPVTDVFAGAVARAASQSTIHPIDTLKVRLQTKRFTNPLGKAAPAIKSLAGGLTQVGSLYKGVLGAASGAGIAIGAYFAVYGVACNVLVRHTDLPPGAVAFVAGGVAAAGSSVVKVPIAVCIRSVQAGVYPNAVAAARSIVSACGPRGLFTGYAPTLLEDVPDMAFKFAAYESLRQAHLRLTGGSKPGATADFILGAVSGAFAAAATTPLDVIKTNMMCTAAKRPTMLSAARAVYGDGGMKAFLRGIGPRAASNGVNSAVFFCFFEAIRGQIAERKARAEQAAAVENLLCSEPLTAQLA